MIYQGGKKKLFILSCSIVVANDLPARGLLMRPSHRGGVAAGGGDRDEDGLEPCLPKQRISGHARGGRHEQNTIPSRYYIEVTINCDIVNLPSQKSTYKYNTCRKFIYPVVARVHGLPHTYTFAHTSTTGAT
eukprot:6695417-Pyramimonas_sp.AAC.1